MADRDVSKPKEPPKPVQIGGESLVDRILPHVKKILVAVILIAVVLMVVFGVRWWKHRGQEEETEKLAKMLAVADRPIALPGMPPDPQRPPFTTSKDRAKAVLEEMSKQDAKPPSRAFRAGLLLEAGEVDQAIAEYKLAQDAAGIEGVVAREGLGMALETKATAEKDAAARSKLLGEALDAYTRMQPEEEGPRYAYALYHQARMQTLLGKKTEAKDLFGKASAKLPQQHELHDLIEKRLAALEAA